MISYFHHLHLIKERYHPWHAQFSYFSSLQLHVSIFFSSIIKCFFSLIKSTSGRNGQFYIVQTSTHKMKYMCILNVYTWIGFFLVLVYRFSSLISRYPKKAISYSLIIFFFLQICQILFNRLHSLLRVDNECKHFFLLKFKILIFHRQFIFVLFLVAINRLLFNINYDTLQSYTLGFFHLHYAFDGHDNSIQFIIFKFNCRRSRAFDSE